MPPPNLRLPEFLDHIDCPREGCNWSYRPCTPTFSRDSTRDDVVVTINFLNEETRRQLSVHVDVVHDGDLQVFLDERLKEAIQEARVSIRDLDPAWVYTIDGGRQVEWPGIDFLRGQIRDLEAKQRIVDLVIHVSVNEDGEPILLGGYCEAYWDVLKLLALQFDKHPDYVANAERWAP